MALTEWDWKSGPVTLSRDLLFGYFGRVPIHSLLNNQSNEMEPENKASASDLL